jgi:ribose 1,5-bisphosphokinase
MSKLFYIIGASGVGKDTLINFARQSLRGSGKIIFAHRYITRPSDVGNENHISLDPEEFAQRRKAGLFALDWESHNQSYGIGMEIDLWMERGFHVVVNGSRLYLDKARQRYATLHPILIEASLATIQGRLTSRGRESGQDIELRIARSENLASLDGRALTIINNDGLLEEAGRALVRVLTLP